MKKFTCIILTLISAMAVAQKPAPAADSSFTTSGETGPSVQVPYTRTPRSITQSSDTSTLTPGSVACPSDDDGYWRLFDLSGDHGITGAFTVESIHIGIESSTAGANLTVRIHTLPKGSPFVGANLTEVGSTNISIGSQSATIIEIPVTGTIDDATAVDMAIEVFAPDFSEGFTFFIGSNGAGQTAPGFLQSPVCGAVEPTDIANLGFPNMHIVMVVDGDEESCTITSITTDGNSVTIFGDCEDADLWGRNAADGDFMVEEGILVDGVAVVSVDFSPDTVYYVTNPGEGPGNPVNDIESPTTIPTLGEWGMIAFVSLLMASGMFFMRRRRMA